MNEVKLRSPSTVERAVAGLSLGLAGAMGPTFAVVMSAYRRRAEQDAQRLRALADLAAVAQSGHPRDRVAQAVSDLAVPRVADLCVIDVLGADDQLHRLAGSLQGDQRPLAGLLARPPRIGEGAAGLPARTRHWPALDAQALRALIGDEATAEALRAMKLRAAVLVPLISRGVPFGRMLLATRSRRRGLSSHADVEYAQTFAGRAALALENAALSDELSSTERQLEAILESLGAAITVRDIHGRMVYANQAAADLLGFPDVASIRDSPPGQIMDRFDVYSESGEPVNLADLPGTRLLQAESEIDALVVRNVVKATGEERWLLNKSCAVTDAEDRVLMVVNMIEDITETKRAEIAQRLLASAARRLTAVGNLTEAFQAIAEAAVPGLADWAGIDVLDSVGEIETVAIAHLDPEKVRLGWRLRHDWPADASESQGIPGVIASGVPELISEISDEMLTLGARDTEHLEVLRAVGLNSIMIVPIQAGEQILGALSFVSSTSRRFDERDLEVAGDLSRQIGAMIFNAQLGAEQAHIARTLQAGLIPASLPDVAGWEVSSAYRAAGRANEVGGDFYDIVRTPAGWAAIIGDVLGKGAGAASLTGLARHTVAAIAESTGDVAHALAVLNRRLRERDAHFHSLCTLAVVEFSDGPTATVYSAGHPWPLLAGPAGVRPVGITSPMLGFVDDLEVVGTPVAIEPGERIILYTDGVLDAVGAEGRFGEEGLADAVRQAGETSAGPPAPAILAVIDGFLAGEQSDDIAILSLTRAPVPVVSLR